MEEMVARNEDEERHADPLAEDDDNNTMDEESPAGEENGAKLATTMHSSSSNLEDNDNVKEYERQLYTMGAAVASAIALHNFPEGLATFVSYVSDPAVGIALAIGIAIHHIPEGLCVAMPIYYATGSRWKGFLWGSFSGMSEPFGALIGWLAVGHSFSGQTNGILFGLVSGIMVYICLDELLPMAFKFNPGGSIVTWTCVFGMFLIAVSLILFRI